MEKIKRIKPDMHFCSLRAWHDIRNNLEGQHGAVYNAFANHPSVCCRQLAELTGLSYFVIQRRVKELRLQGLLKEDGVTKYNGRLASLYRIRRYQEAPDVIEETTYKKKYFSLLQEVQLLRRKLSGGQLELFPALLLIFVIIL